MTQTMKAMEARAHFSKILSDVSKRRSRVVIERSGIPVAVVVSMSDLRQLEFLAEQRQRTMEVLRQSREAFRDVPDEELDRELDKALAEVRQEMAAEREAAARA